MTVTQNAVKYCDLSKSFLYDFDPYMLISTGVSVYTCVSL